MQLLVLVQMVQLLQGDLLHGGVVAVAAARRAVGAAVVAAVAVVVAVVEAVGVDLVGLVAVEMAGVGCVVLVFCWWMSVDIPAKGRRSGCCVCVLCVFVFD